MKPLKVRLWGDGSPENPWHAKLPTYKMVKVDYDKHLTWVTIPEDETACGTIPEEHIRKKYGHRWKNFTAEMINPIDLGTGPGIKIKKWWQFWKK